jgi:putative glutamine amidotransferase
MTLIGITADIEPRAPSGRLAYVSPARLSEAIVDAGGVPVLLPHSLGAIDSYLSRLDGLLISGGGYQFPTSGLFIKTPDPDGKQARARFEAGLIQRALDRDMPLLGICGGFQVLNAVTGGKLIVDLDAGFETIIAHDQPGPVGTMGHEVTLDPASNLAYICGGLRFPVNSHHRQGVIDVGPSVRISARAPDTLVEAIEVPGKRFAIGVQWHLEWAVSDADRRLMSAFITAARC